MNSNWVTVFIFSIVIFYYNRAAAVLNNANDNTNRGYPGLYNVVWHKTISKKKNVSKAISCFVSIIFAIHTKIIRFDILNVLK